MLLINQKRLKQLSEKELTNLKLDISVVDVCLSNMKNLGDACMCRLSPNGSSCRNCIFTPMGGESCLIVAHRNIVGDKSNGVVKKYIDCLKSNLEKRIDIILKEREHVSRSENNT